MTVLRKANEFINKNVDGRGKQFEMKRVGKQQNETNFKNESSHSKDQSVLLTKPIDWSPVLVPAYSSTCHSLSEAVSHAAQPSLQLSMWLRLPLDC